MKNFLFALMLLPFVSAFGQSDSAYIASIEEHRAKYKQDFLNNEHSPLGEEDLPYLDFYAPNPDYAVTAELTLTPDAEPFDLATYSGITKPYVQYGWLDFSLLGREYRMAVYQSLRLRQMPMYRDYLFLPFKDHTNGDATYGGGRYIDLSIQDFTEGRITVDFNKAYNPYCAFSDGYNCPIPPSENHLELAIEAGEKAFKGEH